jgi:hypothetical protein
MSQPRKLQITTIVAALSLALPFSSAIARSGVSHPDIVSPRRIEELPPEIRDAVLQWQPIYGNPLAARRLFAHYLDDKISGYRLVALHFHELTCDNRAVLCPKRGCLHQVYISSDTDGVYRLVFGANVPDVTLRFVDHNPAIEVGCDMPINLQCSSAMLRWDGRGFVEQ